MYSGRSQRDRYTGVNSNMRDDFSQRTYEIMLEFLIHEGRLKQRAMWRARKITGPGAKIESDPHLSE